MTHVLTLVAGAAESRLGPGAVAAAAAALARRGAAVGGPDPLSDVACDLPFAGLAPAIAQGIAAAALADAAIDVFALPAAGRAKRLLVADMEATVIENELLDDLAHAIGRGAEVAALTRRAMDGEIDFAQALRQRVALFAGLPASVLDAAGRGIRVAPGAATLVRTMRAAGAVTALVSGGFTIFVDQVRAAIGFDVAYANVLARGDRGTLTGELAGLDVTPEGKRAILVELAGRNGIPLAATIALGDGANDVPMLQAAGLAIGVHPKPIVARAIAHRIVHGDLTAALYAQGYRRAQFVAD
ncbi:MAG: phosphoserine phosphatase SerB [Alphaproteobacteria bacterium]|nr:phosphoserine phosphatase SerB [Alphaproteobacteria bacterium]